MATPLRALPVVLHVHRERKLARGPTVTRRTDDSVLSGGITLKHDAVIHQRVSQARRSRARLGGVLALRVGFRSTHHRRRRAEILSRITRGGVGWLLLTLLLLLLSRWRCAVSLSRLRLLLLSRRRRRRARTSSLLRRCHRRTSRRRSRPRVRRRLTLSSQPLHVRPRRSSLFAARVGAGVGGVSLKIPSRIRPTSSALRPPARRRLHRSRAKNPIAVHRDASSSAHRAQRPPTRHDGGFGTIFRRFKRTRARSSTSRARPRRDRERVWCSRVKARAHASTTRRTTRRRVPRDRP